MSDSTVYAPLVVVRQADVSGPRPGSVATTCTRCQQACWVDPNARDLAKVMFGTTAAICAPCAIEEEGRGVG